MGPAALPISMVASAGIGAAGSALSANAGKPTVTPIPPPAPLFPGVNQQFTQQMINSGVTGTSFATLNEAAATGLPTDVGPAFDALKASMAHGLDEGRANLIEKFGVAGLRQSSDLDKAGADFESQTETNFANILANYTMQASEAAANRRVAASGTGIGIGEGLATTFAPTAVVTGGAPSPTGSALTSGSQSLNEFMMLKALGAFG